MVAVAIAGAAVVGAGASISASSKASKAAKSAATQNNALEDKIYNQNLTNETPFLNRGNAAGETIGGLLGTGGDKAASENAFAQYRGSTGYDFRTGEGMKALNTGYAARGLIQSGAAMKGINTYAQGQASDEFGRYLGQLQQQQQVGVGAANALAGAGSAFVNGVSSNNNSAASATGNAALASAAAINGGIGNALSAYGTYAGLRSSYTPKQGNI